MMNEEENLACISYSTIVHLPPTPQKKKLTKYTPLYAPIIITHAKSNQWKLLVNETDSTFQISLWVRWFWSRSKIFAKLTLAWEKHHKLTPQSQTVIVCNIQIRRKCVSSRIKSVKIWRDRLHSIRKASLTTRRRGL